MTAQTTTGVPPDCCPGEPCYGDPHGMHTMDCPVYLANVAALERSRQQWPAPVSHPVPVVYMSAAGAGELLARWDAWQCERCGSRYGQPHDQHGAPNRCGGELVPVVVTVTRRAV